MVTKVLILGHSFVKRLFDFIRRSNYHSVDFNMNLDPLREKVYLRGYPGGNLEVINSRGLGEIRRLQPDLVFLQIGSNDLCKQQNSVMDVARGIIEFVLKLRYSYGVHKVAVLQILHRLPPTKEIRYEVDTVWFNQRCDELNLYLSNYFKDNKVEKVCFWRHSGFWSDENKQRVFSPDGVHLNNMHGYPKYYQSLRAAIVSLAKN